MFSRFILLVCLAASLPVFANSPPNVVTSIRPLGLLAEVVVGKHGNVDILMASSSSAHHYSLTVSDRRKLASADIVLWIGRNLETMLEKPLRQRKKPTITALELPNIQWPSTEVHHDDHDHDHGPRDPHLWLNPLNNIPVVEALLSRLVEQYPEYKEYYSDNARQLILGLQRMDQTLSQQLEPLQEKRFIVAHPAYQHFVEHYKLQAPAYVAKTPERNAGAKHLYELRVLSTVQCVFYDYGIANTQVSSLANDLDIPLVALDPLGINSRSVEELIMQLGKDFHSCLSEAEAS